MRPVVLVVRRVIGTWHGFPMIVSSRRRGGGSVGLVEALVAEHGPQHVDPSSGEGQDGVGMSFAFRAFTRVEAS